ncbi:MAG: sugar ABC transporter permease [Lachnospiraceae bacterium]|nr:sugar ABC transporter permease [Lachnospiraceae bacterium]
MKVRYTGEGTNKEPAAYLFACQRILALLAFFFIFIPSFNPARISENIRNSISLFTSAVSYSSIVTNFSFQLERGFIDAGIFYLLYAGAIVTVLGIIAAGVGICMSLGNNRVKHVSFMVTIPGSLASLVGLTLIYFSYVQASAVKEIGAMIPVGLPAYAILMGVILVLGVITLLVVPKADPAEDFEMHTKYQLFLMFLPFALLTFVFAYLPLWGWRYAFFHYKPGEVLSMDKWAGSTYFVQLLQNSATRRDIVRVLGNTLAMSALGIITSWVPLAFAILLAEIGNKTFKRFVQTFTTIPNFISWVLVYTIAFTIFSTEGFISNFFGSQLGWIKPGTNYLMSDSHTWLKMLAWGMWKGTGWSAIIYIAGISGIDQQLYEAATVDGAGRFQKIWHVTIPGLMPTFMVMLLLAVAGALSNGLDQYLVFSNQANMAHMEVLDLYVYNIGIGSKGNIPLSTVVGMTKSIVSIVLFFMANTISKLVRGESIV